MSPAATPPPPLRRPAEGVGNIIRFNWPFYAVAGGVALLLATGTWLASPTWQPYWALALLAAMVPALVSLLVSWYVYDYSGLYGFNWLPSTGSLPQRIVNVHAGFDETSALLQQQFPVAELRVFDFYDPAQHTEASIRRARAAVSPYPGTEAVNPGALPLSNQSTDWVFVLLAAHEIRDPAQRVAFLAEVRRVLAPGGRAVVVEHLRDPANFLAYTIGFLHFYSRATWQVAFRAAGLRQLVEQKITPFVSAFILANDPENTDQHAGNAS